MCHPVVVLSLDPPLMSMKTLKRLPIAVLGVEGTVGDFGSRQSDGQQAARPVAGNLAGPRVRARRRRSFEVAIMMCAFAKRVRLIDF